MRTPDARASDMGCDFLLLLHEPMTGPQILGGTLVLAGVGLASRRSHPSEEANASLCEAGEHE